MIVLDTWIEWLVILAGILLALGVLFPAYAESAGKRIGSLIPHPTEVNNFLKKFGL